MTVEQLKLENETLTARLNKAIEVFRQQAADIKAKDEAYLKLRDEYNEVIREKEIHVEANAKFNKQLLEAEELIKELKASQETSQGSSDEYNELKTTTENLRKQLRDNLLLIEEKTNDITALNNIISSLEEDADNYKTTNEQQVTVIDDLQNSLNTANQKLYEANSSLADYKTKAARYDEVIKALNEKNDELDSLATSRLTDIKKKDEDIVNLNNTIEEINKQLSEISEKHHNLVFNYDELTDKHNLLTEQFADLESEYNNSEDLRKSYTEATTKLNDEVSRLQDIIVSKDAAYKNLESTYNDEAVEHVRDVNALKHTIEQLKSELTAKDEKLTKALAEVGTLTRKLDVASGKVEEAKTKAEVAVTTIKKKLQALNDGLGDEFNIFG